MKTTMKFLLAFALLAMPLSSAKAADFALFGSLMETDNLDSSVGIGIKADFAMGGSGWQAEIRAAYYPELGSNLNEFIEDIDLDADAFEVSATPIDLGITYGFGELKNVFFGGGISYVLLDADRDLAFDDEVGWYIVLGYEGGQEESGVGFFGEVMYRGIEGTVEGNFDDFEVFEFDGTLDGVTLNLGVIWRR